MPLICAGIDRILHIAARDGDVVRRFTKPARKKLDIYMYQNQRRRAYMDSKDFEKKKKKKKTTGISLEK